MFSSIKQLLILLKSSKKYWLAPVVIAILVGAILVVVAEVSPVPLFIYPLI